ncbi:hypothetical protein KRX57_08385 [Weeksellaceae bacterium TAE3-ERU29]|nr:hypothetical protein [Weeksellaceae bacterium TAE3-ERU29]
MENSIRNRKDLENKKLELKDSISNAFNNPIGGIATVLTTLANKQARRSRFNFIDKERNQRNELLDEGTKAILTLVASSLVSRFKLGRIPKMIITSGVALATPYIVDIIQKKIRSRK